MDSGDGPDTVERVIYETSAENQRYGRILWFYMRHEHYSAVRAWRRVFPGSTATDESCLAQCTEFMQWWEQEFPPTFDMVANAHALSPFKIVQDIKDMLEATVWEWDPKLKERVDTGRPDHKMRLKGVQDAIKLLSQSESWRRQFVMGKPAIPDTGDGPPENATVEEWEAWAQQQDLKRGPQGGHRGA